MKNLIQKQEEKSDLNIENDIKKFYEKQIDEEFLHSFEYKELDDDNNSKINFNDIKGADNKSRKNMHTKRLEIKKKTLHLYKRNYDSQRI